MQWMHQADKLQICVFAAMKPTIMLKEVQRVHVEKRHAVPHI